jgi:hypothetical protein
VGNVEFKHTLVRQIIAGTKDCSIVIVFRQHAGHRCALIVLRCGDFKPDTGIGKTFVETLSFFLAKEDRDIAILFGKLSLDFLSPSFIGECGPRAIRSISF